MANTADLRLLRASAIINATAKEQEKLLIQALKQVVGKLCEAFPKLELHHEKVWHLADVIGRLRMEFPDVRFADVPAGSAMRPDGGILSIRAKDRALHPILIAEVKHQGTNDLRLSKGLKRQSMGNRSSDWERM